MSDIESWLEAHGLGKYTETFVENAIDFDVLGQITLDELKELGIPLGDRKRILNAVAALSEFEPVPSQGKSARPDPAQPTSSEAERRQLTVMFCDLVGSVELGERMDVEDYRDLLSTFRENVITAVAHFGGFVARHQGDGLLVYFGYPIAEENDAERAVRAGLEIVNHVRAIAGPDDIEAQVRIGLATGSTLVGDLLDTGGSPEVAALGRTPNLAARLQGEASPNSVLISATTYRVVAGLFECEPVRTLQLKGFSSPIDAHQVVSTLTRARREVGGAAELTPLIGRDEELRLLERRWRQAESGSGQVVLISAEPGVGKSRTLRELRTRIQSEMLAQVRLQCSPYHTESPLHPVVEALEEALGIEPETESRRKLDLLTTWAANVGLDDDVLAVLARLLSIPPGGQLPTLEGPVDRLREKTLSVLVDVVSRMSSRTPVLLLVEDLHWIDPTTQEFLERLVHRVRDEHVLGLFTFRPEYASPWGREPHTTTLALNHLTTQECRDLVGAVSDRLGSEVVEQVVARTDGVALYAEELARALVDAEEDREIPSTLRDALTSRLDRLGSAKELAQRASVLGRTFSRRLLEGMSDRDETAFQGALSSLLESGLLLRRHQASGEAYEFKHALVRDAAYETLLRNRREELHLRAAAALTATNGDPGVIGRHLYEGGAYLEAAMRLREAGERLSQIGALGEATEQYELGLSSAERIPESNRPRELELALVSGFANVVRFTRGRNHPDCRRSVRRTIELAEQLDDSGGLVSGLHALAFIEYHRGAFQEAFKVGRRLLSHSMQMGDSALTCAAHQNLAIFHMYLGEINAALKSARNAIDSFDPLHRRAAFLANDLESRGAVVLGVTMTFAGYIDQGRLLLERGLEIAKRETGPYGTCFALGHICVAHEALREWLQVSQVAGETIALARANGFNDWLSIAESSALIAATHLESKDLLQRSRGFLANSRQEKGHFFGSHWKAHATALANVGQFEEAIEVLDTWIGNIAKLGNPPAHGAGAVRLAKAELLERRNSDLHEVQQAFDDAVVALESEGARLLGLAAHTGQARVLIRQGNLETAQRDLAPVRDWFSEGANSGVLLEAEQILDPD